MTINKTRNSILLVVAAVVWGFAFVVQSIGGQYIGAYTFNGIRMLIASGVLLLVIHFTDRKGLSFAPEGKKERRYLWLTGLGCGFFLFIASNLQQVALSLGAASGKAGFLTAMYILIVPIFGLFLKRRCPWNVWVAVFIALIGMYFLCITGDLRISTVDLLLIACALAFAVQITFIDRFGINTDSLRLSCIQFMFTGVFSMIAAIFFDIVPSGFTEWISVFADGRVWLVIIYMAFISTGVGYTLQIVGMKGLNPTVASLLMSLESVFALLSGWVVLGQKLSGRELIGCGLMFLAICLSQIKFRKKSAV